ncbi:cystatin-B-like, partial [Aotus nancymaae]|uniref:cystatin-B-like n=1 Tax=Aotus nancymaae TaxID=37293 RepID=UPI0030FE7842
MSDNGGLDPSVPPSTKVKCGVPFATQLATEETQNITDQVRSQLEDIVKKFPVFKAVSFKSQVAAGTNYFIQMLVGDEDFLYVRVFRSLHHENKPLILSSYQTNKARHDELT